MSAPVSPVAHPPVSPSRAPSPAGIDPRGPRVGAGLTAVLLVVVLLLGAVPFAANLVLAVIAVGFGIGALRGPHRTVQGYLFRSFVRPRLAPPAELEDPAPPTFAQLVGFVITALGALLGLASVPGAVPVAAGLALAAAFLNAAFGLCLGCEIYLLLKRVRPASA